MPLCFSWLESSDGNLYTAVHKDLIAGQMVLSSRWQQYGEEMFPFKHDNVPVHKDSLVNKYIFQCGEEDVSAHSLKTRPLGWTASINQHQC